MSQLSVHDRRARCGLLRAGHLPFLAFLRPTGPGQATSSTSGAARAPAGSPSTAAERITLADYQREGAPFARVNAALAGFPDAESSESDVLGSVEGEVDVILANPPYLVDDDARIYRHGGEDLGTALSARIVREANRAPRTGRALAGLHRAPSSRGATCSRAAVVPGWRARALASPTPRSTLTCSAKSSTGRLRPRGASNESPPSDSQRRCPKR